jgi:hypothetical protein
LPEVLLQLHCLAALVIEGQIQWNLLVQALVKPYLIEDRRLCVRHGLARL